MTRAEFHELDAASREQWDPVDRCEAPRRILPDLDQVACKACCNTPDEACICEGWSQADEADLRRRINDRSQDWSVRP